MSNLHLSLVALLLCCHAASAGARHVPHSEPPVEVGIVLFDGAQIIDFAAPYEVFGQAGFGVTTLSHDGAPVTTAMGLKVTPDAAFDDAAAFDVLLVPGGQVGAAQKDAALLDFIRQRGDRAQHVLSVCTGSHVLAAAGLLDGLEATTFHRALPELEHRYPEVKVVRDVRWTDNGRIVTSAGLSSGIDAALHVVARVRGEERARAVALHLEYDWRPDDGFVRTRMADRYMPTLDGVQWPDDLRSERLIAIGDERQWRERYRMHTATPADALVTRISDTLAADDTWQRAGGEGMRWVREHVGSPVVLTLATSDQDATGFVLEAVLEVAGSGAASPAPAQGRGHGLPE